MYHGGVAWNMNALYTAVFLTFCLTSSDGCTQGFFNSDEVNQLTQQCSATCQRNSASSQPAIYIIPGMNFTCNGNITSWRAGGVPFISSSRQEKGIPTIQIWREQSLNVYSLQVEIHLASCNGESIVVHGTNTLYECNLSQVVPVQSGDILGLYLTRTHKHDDRFEVYFATTPTSLPTVYEYANTPTSFSLNSPGALMTEQAVPLISFSVTSNAPNLSTTTPTTPPTTPPTTLLTTPTTTPPTNPSTINTTQPTTPPTSSTTNTTPASLPTTSPIAPPSRLIPPDPTNAETTIGKVTMEPPDATIPGGLFETTGNERATPSPSEGATIGDTSASSFTVPIVVVGSVITILLVILIATILIVFVVSRKGKHGMMNLKKRQEGDSHLQNPLYHDFGGGNHLSMVPLVRSSVNRPSLDYSVIRESRMDDSAMRDRPSLDYSVVQESRMDDNAMRFEVLNNPNYVLGLYVPSEEERNTIPRHDQQETIYEVIAERQFGSSYSKSAPKFFTESSEYWHPATNHKELYQQLSTQKFREIPRLQIRPLEVIGSGQFGTVSKGLWETFPNNVMECAIKTLHSGASEEDQVKFLQEAAINGQFHHPYVVRLLGVVTVGEPVMMVLELLENGDLYTFLRHMKPAPGELLPPSTPHQLLKFCQQVAAGMDYLSKKGFVHRDLAARNILVTKDKICKISDFGMSRNMTEDYYLSSGGKVPVKWTAPEAILYKKYSTASDVWSYGALMYEIWSVGHKPFEEFTNTQVIEIINSGYCLPPPPGCPRIPYRWMVMCWNPEKKQRPAFHEIHKGLTDHPEEELLSMGDVEEGCDHGALTIGSPLKTALTLYMDLQQTYKQL